MNRFWLSLILLVITFSWSFGQGPFRVIFSSGNNYQKNDKGFFQLSNGTLLQPKNEIIVMPNGIVILMDSEGRLLELELDGRYIISNLDLTNLSSPSELIYNEWEAYYAPKRKIIAPLLNDHSSQDDFRLDFPASTPVYGRFIALRWPDLRDQYTITLRDEYDLVIGGFENEQPELKLDLMSRAFAFKDFIAIEVVAIQNRRSTGIFVLDRLSPPDKEALDQLLRIFPEDNDLIIGLTKSAILTNRGLYADSATLLRELNKKYGGQVNGFYQDYLTLNVH